jgi:hypothetical protein
MPVPIGVVTVTSTVPVPRAETAVIEVSELTVKLEAEDAARHGPDGACHPSARPAEKIGAGRAECSPQLCPRLWARAELGG